MSLTRFLKEEAEVLRVLEIQKQREKTNKHPLLQPIKYRPGSIIIAV